MTFTLTTDNDGTRIVKDSQDKVIAFEGDDGTWTLTHGDVILGRSWSEDGFTPDQIGKINAALSEMRDETES